MVTFAASFRPMFLARRCRCSGSARRRRRGRLPHNSRAQQRVIADIRADVDHHIAGAQQPLHIGGDVGLPDPEEEHAACRKSSGRAWMRKPARARAIKSHSRQMR